MISDTSSIDNSSNEFALQFDEQLSRGQTEIQALHVPVDQSVVLEMDETRVLLSNTNNNDYENEKKMRMRRR